MYRQHGDLILAPEIEGVTSVLDNFNDMINLDGGVVGTANPQPVSKFRFGSLFPDLLKQARPATSIGMGPRPSNEAGFHELGQAMLDSPETGDHPSLPAGYTFLAQFVAHDVSFDETEGVTSVSVERIRQGRSPSLDLDSLYGMDPPSQGQYYEADGIHLKLGKTQGSRLGGANLEFSNDLPRNHPEDPRFAFIPDTRNDDNLAIAQMHVAFIKFHNAVVDSLASRGISPGSLFEEAKRLVVQHYQWIVLRDFLPKIVEERVLDDVLSNPGKYFGEFFAGREGKEPPMPVEFSFAAFRLGHSLLRDRYDWNRVFQQTGADARGAAILFDLFALTGHNGRMQRIGKRLPSNWIIDWRRFFDFRGFEGVSGFEDITNYPEPNKTKRIDTSLSFALKILPGFLTKIPKQYRLLPVLNLIRAKMVGLPTGQALAGALRERGISVEPLTDEQVAQGPHAAILTKHGFHTQTPLWYYILKEAEVAHQGERLGPLGSVIVASTLVGLIRASRVSILRGQEWRPELGQLRPDDFHMADLLALVKRRNREVDELNPIG
jgi:hypothetical protein